MLIHRFDERLDNFKINSEKFKQKLIKNNALVICSFPIQILLNEYYNDTNIDIFLEENIDFIEYIESMSLYNDRNEYMISFKLINVIVNIILNSEIINNEVYFDGVNFVYSDDILNKHLTNISEENIAKYIGRGFTIDNIDFFATFSAGISFFDGTKDAASIILEADKALYKAKRSGRNRVVTSFKSPQ